MKYLKDDRITSFVDVKDEKVVGFMNVRIDYQLHHMGNVAEILELWVDKEYRTLGIENQFVKKAVELARQNHCDCIETCTRRTNEKAHRFFERAGLNKSHYKLKMTLKY